MTDKTKESAIRVKKAPAPVGSYPHARKAGNLLFLSGVGPRKAGTKMIPGVILDASGNISSYDIEAQCRSVFGNMKDDFKTYNKIYAEYFADNQPCRTTVEINCLPTPIAIELKCVATIA